MALALHACGPASDYAMLQAQRTCAAYIVSPCCIGKLNASKGSSRAGRRGPLISVDVPADAGARSLGGGNSSSSGSGSQPCAAGKEAESSQQHIETQLRRPRSRCAVLADACSKGRVATPL